jgi:cardiolipin synthase (CMP-forming)
MALASEGREAELRRTAEREANLVLRGAPSSLPNIITIGRLLLVPPLMFLIATERVEAAFWVFVTAGISDALDGYIAKRFDAKTELGAILDPLADKVLLDGIYVALALAGILPSWLAWFVVCRDLMIILGVALIQRRDPVFRPRPLIIGKINTFTQILLAACALGIWGGIFQGNALLPILVVAVTVTTGLSASGYAMQAFRHANLDRSH